MMADGIDDEITFKAKFICSDISSSEKRKVKFKKTRSGGAVLDIYNGVQLMDHVAILPQSVRGHFLKTRHLSSTVRFAKGLMGAGRMNIDKETSLVILREGEPFMLQVRSRLGRKNVDAEALRKLHQKLDKELNQVATCEVNLQKNMVIPDRTGSTHICITGTHLSLSTPFSSWNRSAQNTPRLLKYLSWGDVHSVELCFNGVGVRLEVAGIGPSHHWLPFFSNVENLYEILKKVVNNHGEWKRTEVPSPLVNTEPSVAFMPTLPDTSWRTAQQGRGQAIYRSISEQPESQFDKDYALYQESDPPVDPMTRPVCPVPPINPPSMILRDRKTSLDIKSHRKKHISRPSSPPPVPEQLYINWSSIGKFLTCDITLYTRSLEDLSIGKGSCNDLVVSCPEPFSPDRNSSFRSSWWGSNWMNHSQSQTDLRECPQPPSSLPSYECDVTNLPPPPVHRLPTEENISWSTNHIYTNFRKSRGSLVKSKHIENFDKNSMVKVYENWKKYHGDILIANCPTAPTTSKEGPAYKEDGEETIYHPFMTMVSLLSSDMCHRIPNRLKLSERARNHFSLHLSKTGPDDAGAGWEDLAYRIGLTDETVDVIRRHDFSRRHLWYTTGELLLKFWEYYGTSSSSFILEPCTLDNLIDLLMELERHDLAERLRRYQLTH